VALNEIVLVGLNHKAAPVDIRECVAFPAEEKVPFIQGLKASAGLRGGVLLSTCNRVEFYADLEDGARAGELIDALLASRRVPADPREYFYTRRGDDLIRHLFSVAAGLDSMVLGEPQILGQVKEAYFLARDGGTLTTPLNLLFQKAFHVAKKVRTETGIGERPVTVSYAAFNLARSIFEDLTTKRILILGAGEMSRILATHFFESGVRQVKVANRTYENAVAFARPFGAEVVRWEEFPKALIGADIVIASTGAPTHIVHRAMVETVMKLRRNASLLLIDIAVPRDIEGAVGGLDGVYLYNVDDLQEVADEGLAERQKKAELAAALVGQEVDLYGRFLEHQELSGLIEGVVSWAGAIQDAEVSEALRRMGDLTPKQQEILRKTVHRVVHKLLHAPITQVKRLVVEEDAASAIAVFEQLFPARDDRSQGGEDGEAP